MVKPGTGLAAMMRIALFVLDCAANRSAELTPKPHAPTRDFANKMNYRQPMPRMRKP